MWANVRAVVRRQGDLRLSQIAAGIAFWLVIAVFPAGLAIVNVAGLIVDQEKVADFFGRLLAATPGTLGETVSEQLHVVAEPTPGTLVPDVILVLIAVWTVSTGMHHLIRGLNVAAGTPPRGAVGVRALAVLLSVVGIIGLALLAWVLDAATLWGSFVGFLGSLVVLTLLIAVIYRAAAAERMGSVLPGAVTAGGAFVVIGVGLELYASVAQNMRMIYGTVAGVVISMLGVWLAVYSILVGAAVNRVLAGDGGADRVSDQ